VVSPLKSPFAGNPKDCAAAIQDSHRGLSLRSSETGSGPKLPRHWLGAPLKASRLLNAGRTLSQFHPLAPNRSQSSKSSCWPRMKISPLIELDPPTMRPRGHWTARPAVPSDGSVSKTREKRLS